MDHRFSMILTIDLGGEAEWDAVISGRYSAAVPARTPPGEYAPIDPPEPESFEIDKIFVSPIDPEDYDRPAEAIDRINGQPEHGWLMPLPLWLLSKEQLEQIQVEACADVDISRGGDPDYLMELARERREARDNIGDEP